MRDFLVKLKNTFIKNSDTVTVEEIDEDIDGYTELLKELTQLKSKLSSVNQELIELENARNKLVNEIENKLLQNNYNNE